jgi:hypothetical protein
MATLGLQPLVPQLGRQYVAVISACFLLNVSSRRFRNSPLPSTVGVLAGIRTRSPEG